MVKPASSVFSAKPAPSRAASELVFMNSLRRAAGPCLAGEVDVAVDQARQDEGLS